MEVVIMWMEIWPTFVHKEKEVTIYIHVFIQSKITDSNKRMC